MSVAILIGFFFLSPKVFSLCLPDSLGTKNILNADMFILENVAQEVHGRYLPRLELEQELVIVFKLLNPRVNAEITKKENQLVLEVFGGMLSHPKMNENSFRLLLCHEMGHVFGGYPLKSRDGWSSTEGQADYYSGKICARYLGMDEATFIEGALNLTSIYAEVMREPYPKLDIFDEKKVERTNYGYPSVQCRLQTILAGRRDRPRPSCWFKKEN